MIFGGILAGGTGTRMNMADMPKQFLELGSKPMVIHTLEKFLLCPRMDQVYIGVHPNWVLHMEDLVEKYIGIRKENVHIVEGGHDRNETIMNIVAAIEKDYGESEEHYIITHDSVRPFVTSRILEDNIEAVQKFQVCDTVIPATDTIVVSEDGESIAEIPVRDRMYQGQTPQSFQIRLLKELYESLGENEKAILTDACKMAVVRNHKVSLVKGEPSNLKITTVSDYKIAQAMVGGKIID
ncbi:2-C-methyl-D-erythritol 4-phosphate cytidylyltransferase [Lachnospiraceae bacterium KGMB03038]|nr:2-C-methyl-D-erythritol 4-phosphate cytidylyltransferase [Lachnospiraceae bacterium KGMB03038]